MSLQSCVWSDPRGGFNLELLVWFWVMTTDVLRTYTLFTPAPYLTPVFFFFFFFFLIWAKYREMRGIVKLVKACLDSHSQLCPVLTPHEFLVKLFLSHLYPLSFLQSRLAVIQFCRPKRERMGLGLTYYTPSSPNLTNKYWRSPLYDNIVNHTM